MASSLTVEIVLSGLLKARGFFGWLWERVGETRGAANDESWNQ